MELYNVLVLPIAREDIAEIYYYIALDNPDAALLVTDSIMDKIDNLGQFPNNYPLVSDGALAQKGYRMLVIENYIAFFKVFDADVLVYRVLHGRRDYPQLLE